jgi:hypothetical protein
MAELSLNGPVPSNSKLELGGVRCEARWGRVTEAQSCEVVCTESWAEVAPPCQKEGAGMAPMATEETGEWAGQLSARFQLGGMLADVTRGDSAVVADGQPNPRTHDYV